jgi:hypothetical protein
MFKDTESFKKHKYGTSNATQMFSNGYVAFCTTPQQKERQLVDRARETLNKKDIRKKNPDAYERSKGIMAAAGDKKKYFAKIGRKESIFGKKIKN